MPRGGGGVAQARLPAVVSGSSGGGGGGTTGARQQVRAARSLTGVQRSKQGTMCVGEEEDKMAVGPTQAYLDRSPISAIQRLLSV